MKSTDSFRLGEGSSIVRFGYPFPPSGRILNLTTEGRGESGKGEGLKH